LLFRDGKHGPVVIGARNNGINVVAAIVFFEDLTMEVEEAWRNARGLTIIVCGAMGITDN
jgi:hypothetical protein